MKDRLLFYTIDTDIISDSNELTRTLVSFATEFGLEGNIWQHWLTYILMTDENPFSLACERMLIREDSTLMQLAAPDLSLFRELMNAEPGVSCTGGRSDLLSLVKDYRSPYDDAAGTAAGRRIMDLSSTGPASMDCTELFVFLRSDHRMRGRLSRSQKQRMSLLMISSVMRPRKKRCAPTQKRS